MGWLSFFLFSSQPFLVLSQSLPLLLLVSFDGFRWDYPKLYGPLPNFSRLEQRGVRAHSMIPTFTTATTPNHYTYVYSRCHFSSKCCCFIFALTSLITGLYEDVHGLVSDQVYDPRTNETFQSWQDSSSQWWPMKPIWTINEQRPGARSGVIGWPQSSVAVSKYEPYLKDRSFTEMVDQMLRWFNDPSEPINFGAIFFPEPRITGEPLGELHSFSQNPF
jgi:ectonucleotide pyrophosphatase/phosphodiesterase family protein 5